MKVTGPYEQFETGYNDSLRLEVSSNLTKDYPNLCSPDLPIYAHKADIYTAITEYPAVVIISPPGTGKSTQLPKIALEAGFDIIRQTQPRRRAAINVGERIIYELGLVLGEDVASELAAYQTGGGLVGPWDARIKTLTENLFLRQQKHRLSRSKNEMMMIDEIHESKKEQELLIGLAKEKAINLAGFTAVFASATPDKIGLIEYLTDVFGQEPAVVELTARTHDVEYRERANSDIIKETLRAAKDIYENPDAYNGSNTIQVFESGVREITDIIDELWARLPDDIKRQATILPNHAKLSPSQQEPVYEDADGVKIIVQTNIGKTSNTIPRTRYVITHGHERQVKLDEEGEPSLEEVAISQDDMVQQFGRAGRTSDGIAVHTKREGTQYIPLADRPEHMTPEIQRIQLDDIVLYLAAKGDSIRSFDFMNQPDIEQIELAVHRMKAMGAIDSKERITKVGEQMFGFAASPKGQRCMVESLNHPQQIRLAMAAMTAAIEVGGLKQLTKRGEIDDSESLSDETDSDLLAQLDMFIAAQDMSLTEMNEAGLNIDNHIRIQELYRKLAMSAGVTEVEDIKIPNAAERSILRQCILAGYINDVYLPVGDSLYKRLGKTMYLREISDRSVVSPDSGSPIIGSSRSIQTYQKGKIVPKRIVETVTKVTTQEIGRYAVWATTWELASLRPKGDSFVAVEHQILGGQVINAREVPVEAGPRLRAAIIERVKDNMDKQLSYLYRIKSQTEVLAHKSKVPVRTFTEDDINDIINKVTPDDVENPSHVEENLRRYIDQNELSVETYISKAQQDAIARNAPSKLEIDDVTLKMQYKQGKPLVYVKGDPMKLLALPDDVLLDDGRAVLFVYGKSKYTAQQLKKLMRAHSDDSDLTQ